MQFHKTATAATATGNFIIDNKTQSPIAGTSRSAALKKFIGQKEGVLTPMDKVSAFGMGSIASMLGKAKTALTPMAGAASKMGIGKMTGGAAAVGATVGAGMGAMQKDEHGQRGGLGGALKGGLMGGVGGAAAGVGASMGAAKMLGQANPLGGVLDKAKNFFGGVAPAGPPPRLNAPSGPRIAGLLGPSTGARSAQPLTNGGGVLSSTAANTPKTTNIFDSISNKVKGVKDQINTVNTPRSAQHDVLDSMYSKGEKIKKFKAFQTENATRDAADMRAGINKLSMLMIAKDYLCHKF